ncbi:MAG: hypothetical protein J5719_03640 [Bacteroidales bacterium]|nr:hypothetical protein [Bacteroidales bacterium]
MQIIKKSYLHLLFFGLIISFSSCVTLQPTTITRNEQDALSNYKYFYINPTGVKTGSTGYVYGSQYGVYGGSSAKSTEPCDIITGFLLKRGYIRIATIDENIAEKTLIISYGETGRRPAGLGYTINVMLQFTSAKTHNIVCSVSGEGMGETEADDIRIAITRCLETAFGMN